MTAPLLRRLARIAAPIVIGLVVLAVWEAVVRIKGVAPYVLPTPSAIAASLWTDGPSLFGSLLVTLRITLAALAAAALIGGAIALLFSRSRLLEISLFPYAVVLQVTPVVAIAPLIIIWVKTPFLALLVCAWIVAFFPIVSNTTVGLNSADRNLLALFRLYGASPGQMLRYLRIPTALPYFLAGLRISGGLGADRRGRRRVRRRDRRRRDRARLPHSGSRLPSGDPAHVRGAADAVGDRHRHLRAARSSVAAAVAPLARKRDRDRGRIARDLDRARLSCTSGPLTED